MAGLIENLIGRVFSRLTVIGFDGKHGAYAHWLCQCECGKKVSIRGGHLRSGATKSCGCYAREQASIRSTTHGYSKYLKNGKRNSTYVIWKGMKARCLNANNPKYEIYGARGIDVCVRWLHSFENFLEDMGERPNGMTIERKDNNLGYSPENCIWATPKSQARNRRTNLIMEMGGKKESLLSLCERFQKDPVKVRDRIRKGWSIERALFEPKRVNQFV